MVPLKIIGKMMAPMIILCRCMDEWFRRYSIHSRKHNPPYMQICASLSIPGISFMSVCGGLKNER